MYMCASMLEVYKELFMQKNHYELNDENELLHESKLIY